MSLHALSLDIDGTKIQNNIAGRQPGWIDSFDTAYSATANSRANQFQKTSLLFCTPPPQLLVLHCCCSSTTFSTMACSCCSRDPSNTRSWRQTAPAGPALSRAILSGPPVLPLFPWRPARTLLCFAGRPLASNFGSAPFPASSRRPFPGPPRIGTPSSAVVVVVVVPRRCRRWCRFLPTRAVPAGACRTENRGPSFFAIS
mmetsp:Transcript_10133/g.22989  ORF Transcript_10133/g.22989 Transcript_10133/m.22989 type:complete len:200 (-) Transcript_10133:711-1310(-)